MATKGYKKPGPHGLSDFGKRLLPRDCPSIKVAYADPPYLHMGYRYGSDVDYATLIRKLEAEFSQGWAMSCGQRDLHTVLPLCPTGARVAAWVKPHYGFTPNVSPQYGWEPVIYIGGRRRGRLDPTSDFLIANAETKQSVLGQKPEAFAVFIFRLLNIRWGDTFVDLYPGSGAVTNAWMKFQTQVELVS